MTTSRQQGQPWGLRWRSSVWFTTLVVGSGVATDALVYSLPIPFIPFQLQKLHYENVSALSGWLLFAFSGGLVLSTPFLSVFSEHYQNRRLPLIAGLLTLIASQVMFMEASTFWVLALARVLQGISSTAVWVVGLALLSDTVPKEHIGRQLGLATAGLSIGVLAGPALGGLLYKPFGVRGPTIFGICVTVLDLVGRLLVIERSEALRWGYDPTVKQSADAERPSGPSLSEGLTMVNPEGSENARPQNSQDEATLRPNNVATVSISVGGSASSALYPPAPFHAGSAQTSLPRVTLVGAMSRLIRSRRALVAFADTLLVGIAFIAQEPTLPLHAQKTWGLDSSLVGLIMLAPILPALVSSPTAGWLADQYGNGWVICGSLSVAIPCWALQIVPNWLALFIVCYAAAHALTSAMFAPLTAELAAVAASMDDIGYAHVYGVFNIAYGIGSALGPIIGGQIYDHVAQGWSAVIFIAIGILTLTLMFAFCFAGATPPLKQVWGCLRRVRAQPASL